MVYNTFKEIFSPKPFENKMKSQNYDSKDIFSSIIAPVNTSRKGEPGPEASGPGTGKRPGYVVFLLS